MRSAEVRNAAGLRLGYAVKDERGRVLLAAGTELTSGLCEALVRRGYMQVYVLDGIADEVAPQDELATRTRNVATQTARQCFQRLARGEALPFTNVLESVELILADLSNAGGAVLEFACLRSVSDYTYVHSVNVCVYSLLIGQAMGVHGEELRALGAGSLLHDVGKVLCADLVANPNHLTPEEWARMRQHPIDGFEMLRQHRELHLFAPHIAYQHHERLDGSGYPRGLRGDKILPLARMVAVADVYDAMVAHRPFTVAKPPHLAMEELRAGAGTLFDDQAVQVFIRRMAIYPSGTPVLLADGSVAVVVGQTATAGAPLVRVLGHSGSVHPVPEDRTASGERAVVEVLNRWPRWLQNTRPAT